MLCVYGMQASACVEVPASGHLPEAAREPHRLPPAPAPGARVLHDVGPRRPTRRHRDGLGLNTLPLPRQATRSPQVWNAAGQAPRLFVTTSEQPGHLRRAQPVVR
jgi:hypothetical protein